MERDGARAGNESHVADACLCWVVRGQESMPGQSAPQDNAASILCKERHAKRSCLLCKFEQGPGTLRLLTVAEHLSAERWLSTGGQGFMQAYSRVGRSCGVTLLHSTCGCGSGCRRRQDECSVQGAHPGPSRCTRLRTPRSWAMTVSGSVFLLPEAFSVVCTARRQLGIEGNGLGA